MKKILNWDNLSKIGNNKFVKSSYYWLIGIPIVVKILANVNPKMVLTIFEQQINLDFQLPFQWQLMFWASLLFSISVILFNSLCPLIFKENENFNSFINQGFSKRKLNEYSADAKIDISSFTSTAPPTLKDMWTTSEAKNEINSWNEQKVKEYSNIFWHIYNNAREENLIQRLFVGFFFYSGISIIAFIITKNIYYVFKSGFLF